MSVGVKIEFMDIKPWNLITVKLGSRALLFKYNPGVDYVLSIRIQW